MSEIRLIDANALKQAFEETVVIEPMPYAFVKQIIDNAPTVEQKYYERIIAQINPVIEARPQGEWITFPTNHSIIQCSECTALINNLRVDVFKDKVGKMNFCPNCGADMRGKNK